MGGRGLVRVYCLSLALIYVYVVLVKPQIASFIYGKTNSKTTKLYLGRERVSNHTLFNYTLFSVY